MAGDASMSANFEGRSMNSELASRVGGAMTKTAVAVAFVGLAQTGMAGLASASPSVGGPLVPPLSVGQFRTDAPTGPDDPLCIQMPTDPVCEGGPYWQGPPSPAPPGPPTGPLDPSCMTNPADAACVGSPYIPQPPRTTDRGATTDRGTTTSGRDANFAPSDGDADIASSDGDAIGGHGRYAGFHLARVAGQSLRCRPTACCSATSDTASSSGREAEISSVATSPASRNAAAR